MAPRKSKSGMSAATELPRPVEQNAPAINKLGPGRMSAAMEVPKAGKATGGQNATSMPGSMGIIHDVMKGGRGIHGIPGIISSTSLGPEQRSRLVSGIIVSAMGGSMGDQGPVHRVQGHDATAYNAGMTHIAGSRF
jgi:hypothetical protein